MCAKSIPNSDIIQEHVKSERLERIAKIFAAGIIRILEERETDPLQDIKDDIKKEVDHERQ